MGSPRAIEAGEAAARGAAFHASGTQLTTRAGLAQLAYRSPEPRRQLTTGLPVASLLDMRAALATLSALLLLAILAGCRPAEQVQLLFFYTTVCPSCDASRVAVTQSVRLADVAKAHPGWRLAVYDVITDDAGLAEMTTAIDRYQVPGEKQRLPMLLVNGTAHSGSEAVEKELAALERDRP